MTRHIPSTAYICDRHYSSSCRPSTNCGFERVLSTGGRDPPLAYCACIQTLLETLDNVAHHLAYRIESLSTNIMGFATSIHVSTLTSLRATLMGRFPRPLAHIHSGADVMFVLAVNEPSNQSEKNRSGFPVTTTSSTPLQGYTPSVTPIPKKDTTSIGSQFAPCPHALLSSQTFEDMKASVDSDQLTYCLIGLLQLPY